MEARNIIIKIVWILSVTFVRTRTISADLCRPGQSKTILKFFNCQEVLDDGPADLTTEDDNGEKYFEGDILGIDPNIDPQQLMMQLKNAVGVAYRWTDAKIPYEITKSSYKNDQELAMIKEAMKTIEGVSCIRFVEKTHQEEVEDHIQIYSGLGCNSYVGRQGGQQLFSLRTGPDCFVKGIILHELLHAIGFRHEQSRGDRDDYVDINWSNIARRNRIQFSLNEDAETFGQPYDYGSIMHYGSNYFAKDKKVPTITPRVPEVKIGQREGLSDIDIRKLNSMYSCKKAEPQLDAKPKCRSGWSLIEDKCYFYSFHDSQSHKSWDEAEKYCKNVQNGHLATVSTQAIMDALITEITRAASAGIWIGARRSRIFEDNIDWSSGSDFKWEKSSKPWNAADWHNCVTMDNAGQWRDEICSTEHPFVCEEVTETVHEPDEYQ